jgi:hypothetical protein
MKNFAEDMGITGHLTIIRKWNTGDEEVLLDDSNVIVSGMGVGLSYLFTGSGSDSILDYQIDRFQVGVSGPPEGGVTSAINQLSGQILDSQYGGDSNLFISVNSQIVGNSLISNRAFALIPSSKMTRIGDSSVRYTLVLDEEACNNLQGASSEDLNINEIGMFMKNPTASTDDRSLLVCYRTFSNIRKTSDFSLIFRWTLNF